MKNTLRLTIIGMCVILSLVGCENGNAENVIEVAPQTFESSSSIRKEDELKEFVEETYEYNENGKIIIVMYHKFAEEEGKDEWTRSFDNFYGDLKYLYEHGYRSISLNDYINNEIKVPKGCTPVILTFDDGSKSQFNLIKDENGKLIANPNSAVGIMEKFYAEYPEFGLNGTFFINGTGYFSGEGSKKERLEYLINKGFEIGNHTNTHINFSKATPEQIQKEIGAVSNEVEDLTGYKINSLALPFGISSKEYAEYIHRGEYEEKTYENKVILLVGANPVTSPSNEKTNLLRLPRVRARGGNKEVECDLYWWLEKLENNQEQKYYRLH